MVLGTCNNCIVRRTLRDILSRMVYLAVYGVVLCGCTSLITPFVVLSAREAEPIVLVISDILNGVSPKVMCACSP